MDGCVVADEGAEHHRGDLVAQLLRLQGEQGGRRPAVKINKVLSKRLMLCITQE
jgi:hypothetical protein